MEHYYLHDVLQIPAVGWADSVKRVIEVILTPLWHHRERNTVQQGATQRKETSLEMQDLQP